MDRLASMQAFVRVAEAGSFAAAANRMGISAPMVGKHIRFLEERLGVSLVGRTTRRQHLTEAGLAYYERCREILADIAMAETSAAESGLMPRGRLRVTMPTLLGRTCVAPLLLAMARELPELKLELAFTDDFVDMAEHDLAVRSFPAGRRTILADAGLVTRRLCSHAMVVCGAPELFARLGQPATWADLAHFPGLVFGRGGRMLDWTRVTETGEHLAFMPSGRVVMDDLQAIADAATDGHGLALLPHWLVRARIAAGALVALDLDRPAMGYDNFALWHEGVVTPKIRLALTVLAEKLPALM